MAKMKDFGQRMRFLGFSIFLNSAANALTISTNLGSAVWTGSSVNLASWIHVPLGTTMFIYGIVITIMNQLFLGRFDRRRFVSNILYIIPFSYLVEWIGYFWDWLGVSQLGLPARIVIDIIGLTGVAFAVSIYQRCNIIMHPNDDLSYIIRFRFLHGSSIIAQWASYLPPVTIIVLSYLATGQLHAIGFGTIWALVTQGAVMGWADVHVFSRLKHHVDV
ncbi:membrane protein [Levilactobacillus zymae]|uniref:Membrane protein n=1 Tax=Levilactobacillus zymae TaxID=267363 RepID=A0ABQ0WVP9_9LACO|nr:hypothetical protein [Levilactobacillus zymae]QFR62235.1 hypothetical protein LZ395_12110 [Levilactobacillus zymae]GEO71900.1 membrane protein [Levilactobacillus zymae]